jgi:hypothetical protein
MKILLYFLLFTAVMSAEYLSAKDDVVQCGNLIYAGTNTSRCFSDEFLAEVQRKTSIATAGRFKSVKLSSDELFKMPFVVMTGEKPFNLSGKESENLKKYLSSGGFLLASAGCSNQEFSDSFKRLVKHLFPDNKLKSLPLSHQIFHTVYDIPEIKLTHGRSSVKAELFGLEINGRIVLVFSPHGLNDTAHTEGCCCCGGNEIENAIEFNVNILAYALTH